MTEVRKPAGEQHDQHEADKAAAAQRAAHQKAASDSLAQRRAAEDDALAEQRKAEDQERADRRAAEDRVLASVSHRLFLAAAAMTAAVNSGDMGQVRGANGELQDAIQAHLDAKPE